MSDIYLGVKVLLNNDEVSRNLKQELQQFKYIIRLYAFNKDKQYLWSIIVEDNVGEAYDTLIETVITNYELKDGNTRVIDIDDKSHPLVKVPLCAEGIVCNVDLLELIIKHKKREY